MPEQSPYEQLEYAVNILIDRFLPGNWTIRQASETRAIVQPIGWMKKPRTRMANEKFSENGLAVLDCNLGSPVHLVVMDWGLARALASDDKRPPARAHWPKRRAA